MFFSAFNEEGQAVVQRHNPLLRPSHQALLHGHEPQRRLRMPQGSLRTNWNEPDQECYLQCPQRLLHQAQDTEADGQGGDLQCSRPETGPARQQAAPAGRAARIFGQFRTLKKKRKWRKKC